MNEAVTISKMGEERLPTLVAAAVLSEPDLRARARAEIAAYIFACQDPVVAEAQQLKPLRIVDFRDAGSDVDLKEAVRKWMNTDFLVKKVDLLAEFPQWVCYQTTLEGSGEVVLLSPVVSINPEPFFEEVKMVRRWFSNLEGESCQGKPSCLVVLPSQWLKKNACFTAVDGKTILATSVSSFGRGMWINSVTHEANHAAVLGDAEWRFSYSRVMVEGTALLFEFLQKMDETTDPGAREQYFDIVANLFDDQVDHIGGFTAESTYRANGIEPDRNGVFATETKASRGVENLQGLVLCDLLYTKYGGIKTLKEVYRQTREYSPDPERAMREALKRILKMDDEGLVRLEEEFKKVCGDVVVRNLVTNSKGWVGETSYGDSEEVSPVYRFEVEKIIRVGGRWRAIPVMV